MVKLKIKKYDFVIFEKSGKIEFMAYDDNQYSAELIEINEFLRQKSLISMIVKQLIGE